MSLSEDSSDVDCLIHGEPTDFDVGDVHEDGGWDWSVALEVFRASLPRRGDKGGDDRLFLDAMHYFSVQHQLADAAGAVRQVEQRVEALRPTEQCGGVRDLFRSPRVTVSLSASRADVRLDHRPRPCLCCRSQRGATGSGARPLARRVLHQNPSEDRFRRPSHRLRPDRRGKSDALHFPSLLGPGSDVDPRASVGNKGYASKANRQAARSRYHPGHSSQGERVGRARLLRQSHLSWACRPRWPVFAGERRGERRGERCRPGVPHGHWKTAALTGALRLTGMTAPFVYDGAMNGNVFLAYVGQMLVSCLAPGDVVAMESLPAHKAAGIREAIEAPEASCSTHRPKVRPSPPSTTPSQNSRHCSA